MDILPNLDLVSKSEAHVSCEREMYSQVIGS